MLSLRQRGLSLISLTLLHLAASPSLEARETPRKVYGWPLSETSLDAVILNRDAIMGTYVCPALTRLNLELGKSEPVLLDSVTEDEKGRRWILNLKSGLTFWSGKTVDSTDLEAFIQSELPGLVKRVLPDANELPRFATEKSGRKLVLNFEKAPDFGPFILDRIPFYRKEGGRIECVGSLQAKGAGADLVLQGKLKGADREIRLVREVPKSATDGFVTFRFGNELHPDSWERQIEEQLKCPRSIDLPVMTMIAWNPEGPYTKSEDFRRAMTSILPRGALLRAGAGSLGDLISAPILRVHPGYKKSLLVVPYDLKKADAILNAMDLVRSEKDGYRRKGNGDVLELKIAIDPSPNSSLLQKILDDSFRALGMRMRVVSDRAIADGFLTGIEGSWPENDIAPLLHSKASHGVWPWAYNFPELDKALDAYNLSLTREKPDFSLLSGIHELIVKREPFSVLVQHKSCMEYGKGVKAGGPLPSLRNPDWIRAVLER